VSASVTLTTSTSLSHATFLPGIRRD
jgi:hypothetical protein